MDILRHWLATFVSLLCLASASLFGQPTNTVQVGFPGNFTGSFAFLNNLPVAGLDLDQNGLVDIGFPCSCRQNSGNTSNMLVFDSWLLIASGVSAQAWELEYALGALNPITLLPLNSAQSIPEIGQSGIYAIHFAHRSGEEFVIRVQNQHQFPGQIFGPFVKTCRYPEPQIQYLDDYYCGDAESVLLYGSAISIANNQFHHIDPVEESWLITNSDNGQTYGTAWFNPTDFGPGNFRIDYTFSAGDSAFYAPHQTGCSATATAFTTVRAVTSNACHSALNVALHPQTCNATITTGMLALGHSNDFRGLSVEVFTENGVSLGNQVSATFAGSTLLGVLTDSCSGDFCTTLLHIKDYHAPTVIPPPNKILDCTESYDPAQTGYPIIMDCSPYTMSYQDQQEHFPCGNPILRIRRTWRVSDSFEQTTTRIQTIEIRRGSVADLRFPPHLDIDCAAFSDDPTLANPEPGKAGIPTLVSTPLCGMQFIFEDDTINYCGNASFVILRSWTVIDACGFQIFNTDGAGNGNIQFIRIVDQTAPLIATDTIRISANIDTIQNGLIACSASGFLQLPEVSDACSAVSIRVFSTLGELNYHNGLDGIEGAIIPFPGFTLGRHSLSVEATDVCGNQSIRDVHLEVMDSMPPVMVCRGNLQLALTQEGFGRITPSMVDVASRDDCCNGEKLLKLAHEPDSAFRPFIDLACPESSTLHVEMQMSDCFGHYNVCTAIVNIQTPANACPTFSSLSGLVTTATMEPIPGVKCVLTGGLQSEILSSADGSFEFTDLPGNQSYFLHAEKDGSHVNGVSIFDLVLISRHILGVEPLDSPYKIIAADVNRSGTVTTLDLVLIRRVILGADQGFSQTGAWRFIPADYVFPIPEDPFANGGFPETFNFAELKRDTLVHFIGIKSGDVNGTVILVE